jgi:hypothetical protein
VPFDFNGGDLLQNSRHGLLISMTEIHFGTPSFGNSRSYTQLSSEAFIPEVQDLMPRFLLISMTKIHFGTLGFGTSGILASYTQLSSEAVIPEVEDLMSRVLLI